MEPKFKAGDRVVFLYGKMEPHHGTVEKYHGTAFDKKDIYSVMDDTSAAALSADGTIAAEGVVSPDLFKVEPERLTDLTTTQKLSFEHDLLAEIQLGALQMRFNKLLALWRQPSRVGKLLCASMDCMESRSVILCADSGFKVREP